MRALIAAALELGWSLWAYEAVFEVTADTDPAKFRSMEFTNWREREQAANLCRLTTAAPAEPLLVWCGNGHASKSSAGDWTPMGWHFRAMSGTDPFVIDQTVTVSFQGQPRQWVQALGRWAAWMPSWSPPRTLSPKNQKLEWQRDPRPPGKCQVNSDKREARVSTELAYPLECGQGLWLG